MLELQHVRKSYTTGSFTQVALDDVNLSFRDNEFVSILGPSGSGKTTMLNVIGGLDHFDDGDLLIDGVSTREYKDRDWDAYRNNRIGFVFQSYNLIPHQTILANVELALTLSGVSAAERDARARKALEDVGLGEHVDKRPSQLSGGQMQRVAIARALINDPEILLADEPTGALDSTTSVQVMNLLREVAADRLVIMVTHNPELAHEYSTRIVELADGRIRKDSNPFVPNEADMRDAKPVRRTSMSFLTALSLSFNNLMTKKGRTLMTAFAGSIGIIGIAAILALANGVNAYIQEVEEDTLSVYPLQIMSSGFDMTSMLVDMQGDSKEDESGKSSTGQGSASQASTVQASSSSAGDSQKNLVKESPMVNRMFGSVGKNDLQALKKYLDEDGGGVSRYVQDIEYKYGVVPQIYMQKGSGGVQKVNPDSSFSALGFGGSSSALMSSSSAFSTNVFDEMPSDLSLLEDQFDVKTGTWPHKADELVLVLSRRGTISDFMSYAMGLRDHDELDKMVQRLADQESVQAPTDKRSYTYEELMSKKFRVVPAASLYVRDDEFGVWTDKSNDDDFVRGLVAKGRELKIVGIVQPKEDVDATTINMGIYYTPELTKWLMEQAAASKIVHDQLANPSINVISGKSFENEKKQRGKDLDMSSLFSFDESKLANAFAFDTDALDLSGMDFSGLGDSLDLGAMDFSNMDVPQIDLSQMDMSNLSGVQFDLSKVDLSGVDVSSLMSAELTSALTPYVANIDAAKLLDGVTPTVDQSKVQPAIASAMSGLPAYLAQNKVNITDQAAVSAAVAAYFAQPSVASTLMSSMAGAVTFDDAARAQIAANLRKQMGETKLTEEEQKQLDAATQKVVAQLADQVSDQLADQIGDQLQQQISAAMAETFSGALQTYLSDVMGAVMVQLGEALQAQIGETMAEGMEQMMSNFASAMKVDENAFAEAFSMNKDQQELSELMMAMLTTERTSYDNNLVKLGYADEKKPSEIDIYPVNFDSKAQVISILDAYNNEQKSKGDDDKVITYTDIVGALMTSVTEIVNMISTVLIAFVAISLVVSSIMIGVITYISVLERKKEIGILRSIGASKRDVSRVFNAETVIEGFVSGVMGVGITALGCIPANIIVRDMFDVVDVARLPISAALILIGVSIFLSFVAGVIPSRKAAKADPVEALRSE